MYFLGLLTMASMEAGVTDPDYVLCANRSNNGSSPWIVLAAERNKSEPRLIVPDMAGHEDMVRYLQGHRVYNEEGRRPNLEAGIFWYQCNAYGERTGPCYFIRFVGGVSHDERDNRREHLLKSLAKKPDPLEILIDDPEVLAVEPWETPPWIRRPLKKRRNLDYLLDNFGDRLNWGGKEKERNGKHDFQRKDGRRRNKGHHRPGEAAESAGRTEEDG